jgi:hypothetical protein
LLVVVYPTLHETVVAREAFDVLRTLVILAAFRVVFARRQELVPGVGLAAALVAAVWLGYLFPDRSALPVVLALHALAIVFFVLAIASILRTIYLQREVTADHVAGALCVYLLLGVVFAHAYWFIEAVAPGSFHGEGEFGSELSDPRQSQFALQYYSFVTLASVGANDVTPARAAARGVTVLEAICGQLFLAVLIADLIGKKVGLQLAGQPSPPGGPVLPPVSKSEEQVELKS